MKTVVALLMTASCAIACSDRSPSRPTPTSGTIETDRHDAMTASVRRPLAGACTTTFAAVETPSVDTCATFEQVPSAFISIAGECQLTHLGRSTIHAIQQLVFALDAAGQIITVQGQPVVIRLLNCGAYIAANGDELRFTSEGASNAAADPGTTTFSGTQAFVGGTGRFSGASGSATFAGGANLVSSTGQFSLEGGVIY